jgi:tetratricopeptide (TPR) repeat protein
MAKRSKKKERPREAGQVEAAEGREMFSGKSPVLPWTLIAQALVIAAAVLWIYWPALHGDWLWDDNYLVSDNAVVHDPHGLWKIWFDPGSLIDYQPLKVSVSWLQWQLWGNDTLGYHLTNVLLHIVGALLVWRLLSKFGLRLAWLGGLIFAIHPVQVESVAWIAELKNTLSLPPFLLAMCAWIDFEDRGRKRDYFLALGLFLVAMLCKAAMVMFPVVILLYAWWRRGRIAGKDIRASAPFFVVSLALGLVTAWFLHQHTRGVDAVPMGGFFSRLACAGLAFSFYFSTCFLPVSLLPIHPHWVVDPPTLLQFLPWPILLAVIGGLWTKRERWGRHALLGLGFFLINLAPFVGFNAASYMVFTWVMDHVLYIPIIGLIGLAVAGLGQVESRLPASFRFYGIGLAVVASALLALESHRYAGMFSNEETLWSYELRYYPDAYLAYNNLGNALQQAGELTQAMEQYELALQIDPDFAVAHNNLGSVLLEKGQLSEAMEQFERALQIKPDYAGAHFNLGSALAQTGQLPKAIDQDEEALEIEPDYAEAHNNLGLALLQTGRDQESVDQYEQALRIKPDYAEAHYNLGNFLFQTGRSPEAIDQYEQALRIKPEYAEAHGNLGFALQQAGHLPEARDQYEQALRIKPDYAEAHYNLGNVFFQTGQLAAAMEQFGQALRSKADYAEAHNNLGIALYQTGRVSEAIEQFEEAVQIKPDFADARNNLARVQARQKTPQAKK